MSMNIEKRLELNKPFDAYGVSIERISEFMVLFHKNEAPLLQSPDNISGIIKSEILNPGFTESFYYVASPHHTVHTLIELVNCTLCEMTNKHYEECSSDYLTVESLVEYVDFAEFELG